jgi:hypothetical protein
MKTRPEAVCMPPVVMKFLLMSQMIFLKFSRDLPIYRHRRVH